MKTEAELPYGSVTLLPNIRPELTTGTHTDTCPPKFIAVLLAVTNEWRQPKCPSMDEWRIQM